MTVRLNKLLAQRGLGARRKCDVLIQEGAVRVNGRVVTEPGTQVEPARDRVEVRGRPLPAAAPLRYYVLNKPVGVITTLDDPEGRRTVRDFLPGGGRLFPVGRLDADTSGLLVLTNDGELAHHLMHPRYGVEKVYRVRVAGAPSPAQLEQLRRGVAFEPGVVSGPARVRLVEPDPRRSVLEIVLHEGRYRQVRRMCEAVGLAVEGLHRAAYGPLRLGPLARGMWRELSGHEVASLRAASARPRARGQIGYVSPRAGRRGGRPRAPGAGVPRDFAGAAPRTAAGRPPRAVGGRPPRGMAGGRSRVAADHRPRSIAGPPSRGTGGRPPRAAAGRSPRPVGGRPSRGIEGRPSRAAGRPPRGMGGRPPRAAAGRSPRPVGGRPPRGIEGRPPRAMGGRRRRGIEGRPPRAAAGRPPRAGAGVRSRGTMDRPRRDAPGRGSRRGQAGVPDTAPRRPGRDATPRARREARGAWAGENPRRAGPAGAPARGPRPPQRRRRG